MKKRLLNLIGLVMLVFGIFWLISWVMSDDASDKTNSEYQERVKVEKKRTQSKFNVRQE